MRVQRVGALIALMMWVMALWPAFAAADVDSAQDFVIQSQNRYQLGRMYEESGDLTRAEQYYQQALELWPENTQARESLQRLLDARKPPEPQPSVFERLLTWLPGNVSGPGYVASVLEVFGYLLTGGVLIALFMRYGSETVKLAILRSKGIPLLGMGTYTDKTGRLPALPHHLATNMNDAGLTIYDEKGAVAPDFNFIGDTGIPQARLIARALEMLYRRQVQRINVEVSQDAGLVTASVSLADNSQGYVRYLEVVSVDPAHFPAAGELTRILAQFVADAILISLSRDPNTRGLLFQRMGDWTNALKEFQSAADDAKRRNVCGMLYQAHLNLGNLYSFLGLQDKSVAAYTEVVEKTESPITQALIHAAMACSYKNWQAQSPPDQQPTYDWLARQALEKALAAPRKTPLIAYTIACYYSLAGQIQECLRWLREAVAGDLAYLDYAMTDPDMENLRRWLDGRSLGEALGLRVG